MTSAEARAAIGDDLFDAQLAAGRADPPLSERQIAILAPLFEISPPDPVRTAA